ncbi:MAG: DUF2779 domain-containing protein [Flavobacteriales bacterium]|nr:DUF2779 domain-containing protein [Flavobacteriales bacterium]
MHLLSKSTYIRGRQCPKALWLYKHRRELMPPVDAAQQAVFDTGHQVGLLAQQLFPGGVDCSPETPYDFGPAIAATQAAIARGERIIYEAAFLHEGVLAALDILVHDADGWKAYEVKSSTGVKDTNIHDVALQCHVIEGNGIPLVDVSIVHLNNAYVRRGALDLQQLFAITRIKDAVDQERLSVPARIATLKQVLVGEEPAVPIGPHCSAPFTCDFMAHCWAHVPGHGSVFEFSNARGKEWELYARGIHLLTDIPADETLTSKQRLQVEVARSGRPQVDRPALRRWLGELRYPLFHFDFETVMPAVPLFDGTRPYQQLPFQYSVHVQRAPGAEPQHREHLADATGDPRETLTLALIRDLEEEGDVLAYNASFEKQRLQELARDLPTHAPALQRIIARLKDLHTPFKAGWYVAPAMNGRTSIKVVLPALVPELSYADLAVQEGGTASLRFQQLFTGNYPGDVAQLRQDLMAYCGRDTYAMVKVLEVLGRVVEGE